MKTLESKINEGFILVLNLGSSSLKFSLMNSISLDKKYNGQIVGLHSAEVIMTIIGDESKYELKQNFSNITLKDCIGKVISWITDILGSSKIVAIGYRVVQGGPKHLHPESVNEQLLKDLEAYLYLAPNHLPAELELIKTFRNAFIGIPHLACFDTYFHKDMPACAKFYPLPLKYRKMGLVRYGFHGLSYESIIQQLLEEDVDVNHQKIVIAHLGSGSSMVAIDRGKAQDTTMGISPIGGLVMATRTGDLDPGAILFILKNEEITADELDVLLSKESGLKAISGTSDMQEIISKINNEPKAREALDLFCYQTKKQIGAFAAALGGIDILIFCGGIGENAALVREKILTNMEFMGITIDAELNAINDSVISVADSKVVVRVMKTDEELMMAMHIQQLLPI